MSIRLAKATIAAVPCSYCGANVGEPCRSYHTGRPLPLTFNGSGKTKPTKPMICRARRWEYQRVRDDGTLEPSNVRVSSVVNSTVAQAPVDKQTAIVVSPDPVNWNTANTHWRSAGPIRTRPVPDDMPSMIGRTCGQLQVTGLSALHSGRRGGRVVAKPSVWLCRCSCGYYVLRSTHAIRNPHNVDDCTKRVQFRSATGRWPSEGPALNSLALRPRGSGEEER
jgi:hypothetical protein